MKQGNSKKAMTEFLAFPFKTPSTVAGIYVFEFWFPEQWGILSEILFCQFNQSYSKTCYRNPELSSTFSNPISFEVEILLANSQCTEIPWPLMHLCFQRPTEAEGIDLEYRVKKIKFSWTLISLTNAPFFSLNDVFQKPTLSDLFKDIRWSFSAILSTLSVALTSHYDLIHIHFPKTSLWLTMARHVNFYLIFSGKVIINKLITKTIERLIPCLQQFWQMLTIFIPVVGWYFWTKWTMLCI